MPLSNKSAISCSSVLPGTINGLLFEVRRVNLGVLCAPVYTSPRRCNFQTYLSTFATTLRPPFESFRHRTIEEIVSSWSFHSLGPQAPNNVCIQPKGVNCYPSFPVGDVFWKWNCGDMWHLQSFTFCRGYGCGLGMLRFPSCFAVLSYKLPVHPGGS